MTAYVVISDAEIDPESPYTTTLATKIRDNPIAISEGTSPAPKIQTAAIQDNAVTLAKFATNVGYREFILEVPASASTQIDFSALLDATYAKYVVEFINVVPTTNGVDLFSRIQTGGSTWQTGAVYNTFNSTAGTTMQITTTTTIENTAANGGLNGFVEIFDPSVAIHTNILSLVGHKSSSDAFMKTENQSNKYNATTAVTGIRFYMSSGTIASGTFKLYGVK